MNAKSKEGPEKKSQGLLFLSNSYSKVKSRYLSFPVGSCHDFCKYGWKHESEENGKSLTFRRYMENRVTSFHAQNQRKDLNSSDRKKKMGIKMKTSTGIPKKPIDNIEILSTKNEKAKISPWITGYEAKGIRLFDTEFEAPSIMKESKEPSDEAILSSSPEQKIKSEVKIEYMAEPLLDKNVFYENLTVVELDSPLHVSDSQEAILPESPGYAVGHMKDPPTVKPDIIKSKKSSTSETNSVVDKKKRSGFKMNAYNKAKVEQNTQQEVEETGIAENSIDIFETPSLANESSKCSPQFTESVSEEIRTLFKENIQSQFMVDNKLNLSSSLNSTNIELEDQSHSNIIVKLSPEVIILESHDIAVDCRNDLKLGNITKKKRASNPKTLIVPEPSAFNPDILTQKKSSYDEMNSVSGQNIFQKKTATSSKQAKSAFPLQVRVPLVSSMCKSRGQGNTEGKVAKIFKIPELKESQLPKLQKASIPKEIEPSSQNTVLNCNQENFDKEDGELSEYEETQMKQNHGASNQEDKRRARRTLPIRHDDSSSPYQVKFKRGRVIELRMPEKVGPRRLRFTKSFKISELRERQSLKLQKAPIISKKADDEIHENTILDHTEENFKKVDEVSELSEKEETEMKQNHGALNQENNRRARTPSIKYVGEDSSPYKLIFKRGRVIELRETENVGPRRLKFRKNFQIRELRERQLPKLQKTSISSTKDDGEIHENSVVDQNQENFNSEDEVSELSRNEEIEMKQTHSALNQEDKRRPRRTSAVEHDGDASSSYKLKFKRGRVIELREAENGIPRRLSFRKGRVLVENTDSSHVIMKKSFRRREMVEPNETDSEAKAVALKHQEAEEKKDLKPLFNHVIEETASKLVETRKSKVKALVGAFETVISLQET